MKPSIYNFTIKKHHSELERDNLRIEVNNLKNSLVQKDNEIKSMSSRSEVDTWKNYYNSAQSQINNLNNSLSQKNNEINSLKLKLSQKDIEISELKSSLADIKNQPIDNPLKDIEIDQLKKEISPLKDKLIEYKHLADEKMEIVSLLKNSLEELKLDKIELRKDKLSLITKNKKLKKKIFDLSSLNEGNEGNEGNDDLIFSDIINHTVKSEILNDVSLTGNVDFDVSETVSYDL